MTTLGKRFVQMQPVLSLNQGRCRRARRKMLRFSPLLLTILALATTAFARSWRIADYNDEIVVSADGSTFVREHIQLVFEGEWHGIHRVIPIDYPGPNGTNYTLFLDVKSVTDGDGN